jgi:hypothetical protein
MNDATMVQSRWDSSFSRDYSEAIFAQTHLPYKRQAKEQRRSTQHLDDFADISQLPLTHFRTQGIKHLVFDKDNCITVPYELQVYPPLKVRGLHRLTVIGVLTVIASEHVG